MRLDKAIQILTDSITEEMNSASDPELHKTVTQANQAMIAAKLERDANPKYQEAKLACQDLSAGLQDVKRYQTAKITMALSILASRQGDDTLPGDDKYDLEQALERARQAKKQGKKTTDTQTEDHQAESA